MSSPRLGVVRESMLTNPLHIKAPLGQTRSRGLSVPGPDFTYGISNASHRDGGVAEVLSSWRVHSRHAVSAPHQPVAPDFVSLNRDAVKSGLVTSKELSQYRAQRSESQSRGPRRQEASVRPAIPDITFGIKSRASTPLKDLLSHQYARRCFEEQLRRSQSGTSKQLQRVGSYTLCNSVTRSWSGSDSNVCALVCVQIRPGCIPDTRTSLLRRSRPLPATQTPFKLPRFSQVPAALDTFRDEEARVRAFRGHQAESVSRRGHQGLGAHSLD